MRILFVCSLISIFSCLSCTSSVDVQDFFVSKKIQLIDKKIIRSYENKQHFKLVMHIAYFKIASEKYQLKTNYFILNEVNRLLNVTLKDSIELQNFKNNAWKKLFKNADNHFNGFPITKEKIYSELIFSQSIDTTMNGYIQLKMNSSYQFQNGSLQENETWVVIDQATGNQLKVKSIVLDDQVLTEIGERMFRLQQNISFEEDLNEKFWFNNGVFKLPENFYFTDKGITFVFNPYDIAPISFGKITFSIPYALIKENLLIKKEH